MAELMYQISTAKRAKRTLSIPGSLTLYLCPNACARRRGLRALRNDQLENTAFLRFSQADVVTGAYEQGVVDACGRVLDTVSPRPRVVSLYVNCIDDFLGTDARALVEGLSRIHPDVRFVLSRINPISDDVRGSKLQTIHSRLYEPLEPAPEHDRGISLLGHFESIPADSEFYRIAEDLGLGPVREVFSCVDFDEYALMSRSCAALSLSHLGDAALEDFERRLGVRGMRWHATYSIDLICKRYAELAELVGGAAACDAYADKAREAVARAREAVGDAPIAVDSSASLKPFTLALDLLSYGFNVRAVFALHAKADDLQAADELARTHPDVAVVRRGGAEAIAGGSWIEDAAGCLAIGTDAAFMLGVPQAVDMYHDEGFFGFQGVCALMDAMRAAVGGGAR